MANMTEPVITKEMVGKDGRVEVWMHGKAIRRLPVDAREIVAMGQGSFEPPAHAPFLSPVETTTRGKKGGDD